MEDHERDSRCRRALLEVYAANEGVFDKAWKVWKDSRAECTKEEVEEGEDEWHTLDRACTSVMLACCERDDQIEVVMGEEGVLSMDDGIDFASAIDACGHDLRKGKRIFDLVAEGDEESCRAMMRLYAKTGVSFDEVLQVSERIHSKTTLDLASLLVCCGAKEQAIGLVHERALDDVALVQAMELCGNDAEKADMLYKLCKSDDATSSNYALLKVYAAAQVGVVRAINAFTVMNTTDSGLLGIVFACCQTRDEFELVVNLSSQIPINSKTVAQAVENHHGELVQTLYDYLIAHCEPDEWCCQALLKSHCRAGGSYKTALDVFRELMKSGNPNEWTLGAVLSCCKNEEEAKEVIEVAAFTTSADRALIRAIELVSPDMVKAECLFTLFTELHKSHMTLEQQENDFSCLSDREFRRLSHLLVGKEKVSVRTGDRSFMMSFPCGLVQFRYNSAGASLTGVVYASNEASCLQRKFYVTDSHGNVFFKAYASVAPHMKPYLRGANWVIGKYHGNGRKSELLHTVRIVIAKSWIRRCGLAWEDAAEFFLKKDVVNVLRAMRVGRRVRTPPPMNVTLLDTVPMEVVTGPATAPVIAQRHFRVTKQSLRNAYDQVQQSVDGIVHREDIINNKYVTSILEPIDEYMDCSPGMHERPISFEEFAEEVLSRLVVLSVNPNLVALRDDLGTAGDLHFSVIPGTAVQSQMKRRKLATQFLSSIICDFDPEAQIKIKKWEQQQEAKRKGGKETDVDGDKGAVNGLLPGVLEHTKEECSEDKSTQRANISYIDIRKNINEWEGRNTEMVQTLWLRTGQMPVFTCAYIQTFETKAEKAEKKRLEKIRRDQDALGLLLPDDGRATKKLPTLASFKEKRAAEKRPISYKQTMEQPSALQRQLKRMERRGSSERERSETGTENPITTSDTIEKTTGLSSLEDYDPYILDDPDIKSEKKRKILKLPTLRASVIPYSKRKDLKKDVNQQFLLAHPWIETTRLSLTGIRKAKMIMINLALQLNPILEASTVAYAVVYFERLILKQIVTKANRKLVASVCCVLAYKFWESSTTNTVGISSLLRSLEEHFDVKRKRILQAEFKIYALLNFDLLVPQSYADPHFERLLALYNITIQEYLNRKDNVWGITLREEGTAPVIKPQV
eukprot:TRINITY_DN23892_c0_g2_i1.p1 TRINITY_DN23892_c0_g2~~TRINITY_DN23892_c0_g2_i1.p1  ORF type:complete len:1138 (+),score=406.43 TRINITY_DN23892_c0_g2_i1:994-4407(+)